MTTTITITDADRAFFLEQDERFVFWLDALASGQPINSDEPSPGFFQKRNKDKQTGAITWTPVAFWFEGDTLACQINGKMVDRNRTYKLSAQEPNASPDVFMGAVWGWVRHRPISHTDYTHWVETGHRPGALPIGGADDARDQDGNELSPLERLTQKLDAAIKLAKGHQTIETAALQAQAQTVRASLLQLVKDAETGLEDAGKPHKAGYDAYRELMKVWNPLGKLAKDTADALRTRMERGATVIRQREAAALAELAKIEAANAAAAASEAATKLATELNEWREAAAPPPVGHNAPPAAPLQPPPPAPIAPTATVIRGATGRAAHAGLKYTAEITDWVACFAYFQLDKQLQDRLQQLANQAVDKGAEVPGTKKVEGTRIS